MLTALKIGLLALLPLGIKNPSDSMIYAFDNGEQNIVLKETFEALGNSQYGTDAYGDIYFEYNQVNYSLDTASYLPDSSGFYYYNNSDSDYAILWVFDTTLTTDLTDVVSEQYQLVLYDKGEGESLDFQYAITMLVDYSADWDSYDIGVVTEAIEQDIANANMPSISDIFAEVTSAITSFVGSLGQAFNSVTTLFYANGNWTFLGVLILIGVGVGLVYGAYRLIKGLLHRV